MKQGPHSRTALVVATCAVALVAAFFLFSPLFGAPLAARASGDPVSLDTPAAGTVFVADSSSVVEAVFSGSSAGLTVVVSAVAGIDAASGTETVLCSAVVAADRSWSCTATRLPDFYGPVHVRSNGDETDDVLGALNPPVVTAPLPGDTQLAATTTVAGTAAPASTVTVAVGGAPGCSATTSSDGRWSCSVTLGDDRVGSNELSAIQTVPYSAVDSAASPAVDFVYAPLAPVLPGDPGGPTPPILPVAPVVPVVPVVPVAPSAPGDPVVPTDPTGPTGPAGDSGVPVGPAAPASPNDGDSPSDQSFGSGGVGQGVVGSDGSAGSGGNGGSSRSGEGGTTGETTLRDGATPSAGVSNSGASSSGALTAGAEGDGAASTGSAGGGVARDGVAGGGVAGDGVTGGANGATSGVDVRAGSADGIRGAELAAAADAASQSAGERAGPWADPAWSSPTVFGTSLRSVQAIGLNPPALATIALAALGFLLLLALPAELLQSTIRENYDRFGPVVRPIERALSRARRRLPGSTSSWQRQLALIAGAATIMSFADPTTGIDVRSVRLILGLTVVLLIVNYAAVLATRIHALAAYRAGTEILLRPWAVVLMVSTVALSRFTGLQPAIVFGLILGIEVGGNIGARLTKHSAAKLAVSVTAVMVALGVGSWMLYSALGMQNQGITSFGNQLLAEVLSGLTVETLTAPVIALLPLTFLDGQSIFAWSKAGWAAVYAAAVAVFALVLLPQPSSWVQVPALISPWVIAFAAFAVVSVGVWAYFRYTTDRQTAPTQRMTRATSRASAGRTK